MQSSGRSRFAPPSTYIILSPLVRPLVRPFLVFLFLFFFFLLLRVKNSPPTPRRWKIVSIRSFREVEKTQRTYSGVRFVYRDLRQSVGFIYSFIIHFLIFVSSSPVACSSNTHEVPFVHDICFRWTTEERAKHHPTITRTITRWPLGRCLSFECVTGFLRSCDVRRRCCVYSSCWTFKLTIGYVNPPKTWGTAATAAERPSDLGAANAILVNDAPRLQPSSAANDPGDNGRSRGQTKQARAWPQKS